MSLELERTSPTLTADEPAPTEDERRWHLRMKDLCEASGLDRQAIHFYIQQELLPPGRKTGRNMAWYSDEHLERLLLIKKLQHERFLPLKAIKALLDGKEESFTPEQHAFLAGLKSRLKGTLAPSREGARMVDAERLLLRTGVERRDLEEAIELGLVAARAEGDQVSVSEADSWMIELFGQMRRLGFSRELGFTVEDVAFYEEAMSKLFREEMRLLSRRLAQLPPDEVAKMIERALPVIHTFLTRYHTSRVRAFFESVDD
ncbi:MAG: MerR family transcriptional regulator [Myxococcales bacterium]|nr:MerR family transcriptional regulator [Myxococcales bacterium]